MVAKLKNDKTCDNMDAVHIDNLENLLSSYGILDKFNIGEANCKFCKQQVSKLNIYSIFKDSGMYKLVCDDPNCIQSLLDLINKRKEEKIDAK